MKRSSPPLRNWGIGYVAFSPLANGILSDSFKPTDKFEESDFRNRMPQYSSEGFEANRALMELIRELAAAKNATPAQISPCMDALQEAIYCFHSRFEKS